MNTTKSSKMAGNVHCPAVAANYQPGETKSETIMKKAVLTSLILMLASIAYAQTPNVPSGLTGLWRFQDSSNKLAATVGEPLITSNPANSYPFLGPWTDIGIPSWHTKFSDGGVVQERSYDYLTVDPDFTANGGGAYVNAYTIAIDYVQTSDASGLL